MWAVVAVAMFALDKSPSRKGVRIDFSNVCFTVRDRSTKNELQLLKSVTGTVRSIHVPVCARPRLGACLICSSSLATRSDTEIYCRRRRLPSPSLKPEASALAGGGQPPHRCHGKQWRREDNPGVWRRCFAMRCFAG